MRYGRPTRTIIAVMLSASALGFVLWLCSEDVVAPPSTSGYPDSPSTAVNPTIHVAEATRANVASVTGRVRDSQGRSVGFALVCASAGPNFAFSSEALDQYVCAQADQGGQYELHVRPGVYVVRASAPAHLPASFSRVPDSLDESLLPVAAEERLTGIDVILRPGGVLVRGVVRDLSGGEIENALVTGDGSFARSDSEGRFLLWARPGVLQLRGWAEGYATNIDEGPAGEHEFDIVLEPESILAGKVVLPGGGPVADARVTARSLDGWADHETASGTDGFFRFRGLSPGRYALHAESDSVVVRPEQQVGLGFGQTLDDLTLTARPALFVGGRLLTTTGAPCPRGSLYMTGESMPDGKRSETDESGSARIRGLLPGEYVLSVQCDGFLPIESRTLTLSTQSVGDLVWEADRGRAIRGRVLAASGKPSQDLVVHARQQASDKQGPRVSASTRLGTNGSFELTGLVAGRYDVLVRPGPQEPTALEVSMEVSLSQDRDTEDVEIVLPAVGEVAGTVRDLQGHGLDRVQVHLFGDMSGAETWTTDRGEFRFPRVQTGRYSVFATRQSRPLRGPGTTGTAQREVEIRADELERVELVVEAADAFIRGQVVDGSGGPIVDAYVQTQSEAESGGQAFSYLDRAILTDADGRFTVSGLLPGKYTVKASRKAGGESLVAHVETGSAVVLTIDEGKTPDSMSPVP
ncbi:carboxypeptidase-like regulatory domain-containing protein [Nannocystis radixulma]|uniref:Carboxypeptidase-like regulatory domain-containing protein n=1 Tax=Nannocystis radixulma TaxID=2995305 RepID=A0ABT5AYJ8_9BACT|nr:carboxypeptidase-like regulatory domain-containing protein [Nannocystis radixulma]MDC0666915.1 carboxypeptidase-like regulatory domain-containing protein [Nannocystis radixulma]